MKDRVPQWLAHVILAKALGKAGLIIAADGALAPLARAETPIHVPQPTLRLHRAVHGAMALRRDPEPCPVPARTAILLVGDGLSAPTVTRIAKMCQRPPDILFRPDGMPPGRYESPDPRMPDLFVHRGSRTCRKRLDAALADPAIWQDPVDAASAACTTGAMTSDVDFGADGAAALGFDPLACLRSLTEADGIQALLRGKCDLVRQRPVHLRVPTLGMADAVIRLSFSADAPSGTPACRVVGPGGRAVVTADEDAAGPILTVALDGHTGGFADLSVTGHRLHLRHVSLGLGTPDAAGSDDVVSDPLQRFEDPLEAYAK